MNKSNYTFKDYVKEETKQLYLPLFVVFFVLLILQLFNLDWCKQAWIESDGIDGKIMATMGLILPLIGSIILGYKGLYQYWIDYINKKTR